MWNKSEVEGGEDCDATVPLDDYEAERAEEEDSKAASSDQISPQVRIMSLLISVLISPILVWRW